MAARKNALAGAESLEEQAERVERLYGQPSVRSKDLRRQAEERRSDAVSEVERWDRAIAELRRGRREEALDIAGMRIVVSTQETLERVR